MSTPETPTTSSGVLGPWLMLINTPGTLNPTDGTNELHLCLVVGLLPNRVSLDEILTLPTMFQRNDVDADPDAISFYGGQYQRIKAMTPSGPYFPIPRHLNPGSRVPRHLAPRHAGGT